MKKYVRLGLTSRNVESLITLGSTVYTHMKGNVKFPASPVDMAAFNAAMIALTNLHNECTLSRSTVAFAQERNQVVIVEDMLRKLGNYVDIVASGDEAVINDAGMPASKTREKNPAPAQITDITASYTGLPGTIMLAWKRPQFSKLFRVYMSSDPTNQSGWQLLDTITTRKMLVENLTRGARFYFQVVPVGTAGYGPVSAPVNSIAA